MQQNKNTPDFKIEKNFLKEFDLVLGIDEAGRGSIAGPLAVGAVCIKRKFFEKESFFQKLGVKDSKLLSPKKREEILKRVKITFEFYTVVFVSNNQIDKYGIGKSFTKALERIEKMVAQTFPNKKTLFLIDFYNYKSKNPKISTKPIKKGDKICISISLAGILAKVKRDEFMQKLHKKLPIYRWNKNKGYGTKEHFDLLKKHSISKYHRRTFICF